MDRYRKDSEPVLTIGERPGSELVFIAGARTLDEVKSMFSNGSMEGDDIQRSLNRILAELGVPLDIDFEKYVFSSEDIKVFAEIFYSLEEFRKGRKEFQALTELHIRIANLFFYTAKCADTCAFEPEFRKKVVKDLLDEAHIHYDHALSEKDGNVNVHANLGFLYLQQGLYDESKAHFEKALEMDDGSLVPHVGLARLLIELGEYDKADNILDKLISLDKKDPRGWFLKGEIIRIKGLWGGAIQMYEHALECDSGFKDALMMRGRVFFERKMYDKAKVVFNQMIHSDDYEPGGWFWKGNTLHTMGKWADALDCVNEALSTDSQMVDAWILKGDIFMGRNVFEEALLAYKNALKIEPDSPVLLEKIEKCQECMY